jgi:FkbM family methyltransferase
MSIDCVVIDAGARYGLHPTWAELRGLADFHMFEMDNVEAARLEHKYQFDDRIKIYPIALYSRDEEMRFRVSEHQALNSVFASNQSLLEQNDYMLREFAVTQERVVEARSIDSLFADTDIHFMKLDVEGAEFELLQGSKDKLSSTLLGLRSEVLFAPIYEGAPLFGDINQLMLAEGFELLNFDYTGAGNKAGRYTLPGRYGKLLSSDAVWIVNNDRLFAGKGERLAKDVIRLALFLMLNGATDQAIDVMTRAVDRDSGLFEPYRDDPLFIALHRKALFLFKSLISLPMFEESDITSTYKKIFARDFPLMNEFYQSDIFT